MADDADKAALRARIIKVARGFLGTPFHDQQSLKGVGIDCAHLLREVYVEAGVIETFPIAPYSPQFMLHTDEGLFEGYVRKVAREIEPEAVRPGDIVLYKVGRSFAHGGIIVEWPRAVIHAFKSYGKVVETPAFDADLHGRKVKFFSHW